MQKGAKVGLLSRIDYGGKGFRNGLVQAGFDVLLGDEGFFTDFKGTHFNLLLGGLVDGKALKEKMNSWVQEEVEKDKDRPRRMRRELRELPAAQRKKGRKQELEGRFLLDCAKDLAKIIPMVKTIDFASGKEKLVDLFIATSPAPAFDGKIGETVANHLGSLRDDIRVWNAGGDRFPVKYVDMLIWGLTPLRAAFRSKYHSTPAENIIEQKIGGTGQSSPDVFIVGCAGTAINKPKGELKYAYYTVPVLSRLEEIRIGENQIGVSVLEIPPGKEQASYRVYNLKDVVSSELSFIVSPKKATKTQKRFIKVMKDRGWATPGLLRYEIAGLSDEKILGEMEDLMTQKTIRRLGENWPGVIYREASKKYYFDLEWIQQKLKYPVSVGPWNEDRIFSYSCLHAGSTQTDYQFFLKELPRLIIKYGATMLIDIGDTVEGLQHDLDKRGEIVNSMKNLTFQDLLAAELNSSVICDVFDSRFDSLIDQEKVKLGSVSREELRSLISRSLLEFDYILGNHDLWVVRDAQIPLALFHVRLVDLISSHIDRALSQRGFAPPGYTELRGLVGEKIVRRDFKTLGSGLKASFQHPHMARAKTTSLRPQAMLDFGKRFGCQVVIGGNFHVAETVLVWDMDLGQCASQEVGTIKHGSEFETHKMKMVDQGVSWLRILSKDSRIHMVESAHMGSPSKSTRENSKFIERFIRKRKILEKNYLLLPNQTL